MYVSTKTAAIAIWGMVVWEIQTFPYRVYHALLDLKHH